MPWAAIGAGAASLGTGILSYLAESSANDRAALMQDRALQQWLDLTVPDPEQQKIILEKFVLQGKIDPILQQAIKQDPSAFNQIATDASQKTAQNRALGELESIGYQGGLRLQDKEALQEAQLRNQAQERGERQGIAANMSRRGLGGSGFDAAAQLQAQQSSADRNSQAGLSAAAAAQDRALQAIQGAGSLASQYRTQDFGEQAQKASASDRINAFNTQNLRNVNAANVGLQNRAQEMNLQNQQDIANKNTNLANEQEKYNKSLLQQQYENQLRKLGGYTGQSNTRALTEQHGGEISARGIQNIGSAISGSGGSAANGSFWDDYFKNGGGAASGGATSGGLASGGAMYA